MADQKVSDLTAIVTPAEADLFYLLTSGGADRKLTLANLRAALTGELLDTVFRYKTANQTSTSASLQTDTHLTFPIAANELWCVDYHLLVDGPTAGDISLAVNVPSGATGWWSGTRLIAGATGTSADLQTSATTDLTDTGIRSAGLAGAATLMYIKMTAFVKNGANAGTVALRWSQVAPSGTTTLNANSYLEGRRYSA